METEAGAPTLIAPSGTADGRLTLRRLIYVLCGLVAVAECFAFGLAAYLSWVIARRPLSRQATLAAEYSYPAAAIFFLIEMLAVLWIYRPVCTLLAPPLRATRLASRLSKNALLGLATGLALSAPTVPLVHHFGPPMSFVISTALCPLCPRSIAIIVCLGVGLPIATELVFRAIVFRTLEHYAGGLPALLASCLLFGLLWPLFNWVIGLALGIAGGILYYRTRSLLPGILANATLTFSAALLMVYYSIK